MTLGQALASWGRSVSQTCSRAGLGHGGEGVCSSSMVSAFGHTVVWSNSIGSGHKTSLWDSKRDCYGLYCLGGHLEQWRRLCLRCNVSSFSKENKVDGSARKKDGSISCSSLGSTSRTWALVLFFRLPSSSHEAEALSLTLHLQSALKHHFSPMHDFMPVGTVQPATAAGRLLTPCKTGYHKRDS